MFPSYDIIHTGYHKQSSHNHQYAKFQLATGTNSIRKKEEFPLSENVTKSLYYEMLQGNKIWMINEKNLKKSPIWETLFLSTDADISTNAKTDIFLGWGKGIGVFEKLSFRFFNYFFLVK